VIENLQRILQMILLETARLLNIVEAGELTFQAVNAVYYDAHSLSPTFLISNQGLGFRVGV
jgi:hypothetical protein